MNKMLAKYLWPEEPGLGKLWMILDAARDPEIFSLMGRSYQEKCCLYAGELAPEVARAAPYLAEVEMTDWFTKDLFGKGWGASWGILFRAQADLATLRKHFRRFLMAASPEGKKMLFRYYDPRVWRTYLPTCAPDELQYVFGPVKVFICEGEALDEILEFRFDGARLDRRVVKLAGFTAAARVQ